jgi:hypothetical protein
MTDIPENTSQCFGYDAPLEVPILDDSGNLYTMELPAVITGMSENWDDRVYIPSNYYECQQTVNMTVLKLAALSILQSMFNEIRLKAFADSMAFKNINKFSTSGILTEPVRHGTFGVGLG